MAKEAIKRLRAAELVKKIVYEGKSNKQAATELGISHDTATRTLAWAEEAKIFVQHEQRLFTELLPLAHETMKQAMEDGDATVAIKIMEMVEKKASQPSVNSVNDDEGIYGEIRRQRAGRVIDVTPGAEQPRLSALNPAGSESDVVQDGVLSGEFHRVETTETDQSEGGPEDGEKSVEGEN